jgi:hypothetical protein
MLQTQEQGASVPPVVKNITEHNFEKIDDRQHILVKLGIAAIAIAGIFVISLKKQ